MDLLMDSIMPNRRELIHLIMNKLVAVKERTIRRAMLNLVMNMLLVVDHHHHHREHGHCYLQADGHSHEHCNAKPHHGRTRCC